MDFTASPFSYQQTGYFSKIVLDYIHQEPPIRAFYNHSASLDGIRASINERKLFHTDRVLLHNTLTGQYNLSDGFPLVQHNIDLLLAENTFTVCTAHQPNIFTGQLYFIYKILHAVKLAGWLKQQIPDCNFVPVYYMGSEDADLEELGHIFIDGEKYTWETNQSGAVGRMKVDKALIKLLDTISGQLLVHPHGAEIISIMKACYVEGQTIEQATFQLLHKLFGEYGLVILLPDSPALKQSFLPIIEKEIFHQFSHLIVAETVTQFPREYKVQASGRELNMFYLIDNKRERIERNGEDWVVINTAIKFNRNEIIAELQQYPERFSPNVILRPVLQEWVLPNIAFIGGGGEIAYWLQLKNVFMAAGVPYPILILRNSFMVVTKKTNQLVEKLKLTQRDFFLPETSLIDGFVKKASMVQLTLKKEQEVLSALYDELKIIAGKVDITLHSHAVALQVQALKKLAALEKKMLRAEKKKFDAEKRQILKVKSQLFPGNTLQERVDNLMPYYAAMGKGFIKTLYDNSLDIAHQFTILIEKEAG